MAIGGHEARRRFFALLEQVNIDHLPVRIVSATGDAVLMSAAHFDSWNETVYLLQSPENARRLMDAVAATQPATHHRCSVNARTGRDVRVPRCGLAGSAV